MSNSIGSASLLIVPTFDGLTSKMNAALGSASTTASASGSKLGQSTASGFGKGLLSSGALIGAFSSITSAAMSSISSHVDSAVARFDTLNNYPKVMETLGYSAKEADSSIQTMSDRLSTLPTRLDEMASTVQGIVAVTGDLTQATEVGLAVNDMLLASGSSTQLVSAATEQFRQMLAKGKPELEDWKSLTQAMPGQMKQLAEEMLGAGHSANDLYYALGGGKESDAPEGIEWASITMDQLLDTIVRLDQEGGDGITSFKEQAETAAGGISTAMSNLSNAVTKGITGVLDTIGKENIATVFSDMKTYVNEAFSAVNSAVSSAMPYVKQFYGLFKSNAGTILTATASFTGLTAAGDKVRGVFSGLVNTNKKTSDSWATVKSGASDLKTAFGLLTGESGKLSDKLGRVGSAAKTMGTGVKGVLSGLVSAIDPASLAITGVSAAVSVGIAAYTDWKTKTETLSKATDGLNDSVSRAAALSGYAGTIENVGKASGTAAKSADELAESIAKSVDAMNENTSKAETTIATLNTAQRVIDDCAGKTDLSTEAQGKLKWALEQVNEQLGLTLTATDVANNSYDSNGEYVDDLKAKIDELIASKKEEARVSALTANLTEAYQNQSEAAKTFAQCQADVNSAAAEYQKKMKDSYGQTISYEDALKAVAGTNTEVGKSYRSASEQLEAANSAVSSLEDQLGRAGAAAEGVTDKLSALASDKLVVFEGAFSNSGQSIAEFSSKLEYLGVSTEELNSKSAEELASLANCFDGTAASVVGKLDEMGVGMDENAKKVAYNVRDMRSAFADAGIGDVLDGMGSSVNDFAMRCSDAGLTAENFAGMSSDSFARLSESCEGNVDKTIATIAMYNAAPLVNKDGTVNVDDALLVGANNHIYTYNGTELYDKTAGAVVDSASVTDATGVAWEWNGTALVSKQADATVTGNAVTGDAQGNIEGTNRATQNLSSKAETVSVSGNAADGSAASNIWSTVSAIANLAGKTVTNIVETIHRTVTEGNAAGGIRPHAAGGIRYHAGGAIVNNPGPGVPLDIVGEDGAEAIVPLTNKKYVTPFARAVAEQVAEVGGGNGEVLAAVLALAESIKGMETAVYVDGKKLASTIARPMNQQLGKLSARGC